MLSLKPIQPKRDIKRSPSRVDFYGFNLFPIAWIRQVVFSFQQIGLYESFQLVEGWFVFRFLTSIPCSSAIGGEPVRIPLPNRFQPAG